MKKNTIFILSILLALSLVSGCSQINKIINKNDNSENNTSPTVPSIQENTPAPTVKASENDIIKNQIIKMTLDEKIGQMVMSGVDGTVLGNNTMTLIKDYHVGGFVILGENVKNTNQLLALVNSIKSANSYNSIPLFLSIDQEGGRIDRMPSVFKRFPSNKVIGEINNGTFSYKIGTLLASELNSFGFNMDFAPVLDINSNPKNPVIGDRSFGAASDVVTNLGIQTMKGIRSQNIIPVVKHFPGHGDTSVDSHVGLPSVNNDIKRLKSFELLPFAEAIKNNADAVMVAHILLTQIDPENPSSMSKTIINNILRTDLNFQGVIITDDMTMGAITKNYNIGDAAVKSVNAGSDIILVCHHYDNELSVINALKAAVQNGSLSESRVDESVYRILKLKQKYMISSSLVKSVNIHDINNRINSLINTYIK